MSKWVRVDRRYNNPYRLTAHAHWKIFKWGVLSIWWVTTILWLNWFAWLCMIGLTWIALGRPGWARLRQGQVDYEDTLEIVDDAPIGERNTRSIPQDVKVAVAARDHGRCRQCGSTQDLHFDHVIPWSKGGANTVNNIQLLCGSCNRSKSAKWDG